MNYNAWYQRHIHSPFPKAVQQRLDALGVPPNFPKSWVQTSPRMRPGMSAWAASKAKSALDGLATHVSEETEWRGFPGATPASIAFYPDGTPWLNEAGEPVPVDQWESGHITVDDLLEAANNPSLPPAVRKGAWKQALWLRDSVLPSITSCKVGKLPWFSGNARAAGWGIRFLVRQYRAMPDGNVAMAIGTMLMGLDALATKQGAVGKPWPFYNPEGSHQADHFFCDLTTWMIVGPLLSGLCEVKALAKESGAPALPAVDALIDRCLAYAEWAFAEGEKATGLPGRLADDLDHADPTKVHIIVPTSYGAMVPWSLMGLADADEQGLLSTTLKAKALALYRGCSFFDTSKAGFGADAKLLGLTIRCAGQWGFNPAT